MGGTISLGVKAAGPGSPAWDPAPGALGLGAALLPKRGDAGYCTDLTKDHGATSGSCSPKVVQEREGRRGAAGQGVLRSPRSVPWLRGGPRGRRRAPAEGRRWGAAADSVSALERTGMGNLRGAGLPSPLPVEPRPPAPGLRARLDRGARAK